MQHNDLPPTVREPRRRTAALAKVNPTSEAVQELNHLMSLIAATLRPPGPLPSASQRQS